MKTIAITIPFGMSVRNIVRSDTFKLLSENARIVMLTPFAHNPDFKAEFSRPNVLLEKLVFENNFGGKVLRKIMDPVETWLFTEKTRIATLLNLRDHLRALNPWRYCLIRLMAVFFGWQPLLGIFRNWHRYFLRSSYYERILSRHEVNLVFITNPFNLTDQQVAITARRMGLPLIGMMHSWDNPTSKPAVRQGGNIEPGRTLPLMFDRMIVWNEVLCQELVDFFDYAPSQIDISGIPQFDIYINRQRLATREEFLKSLGADPRKKLILHAVGSPNFVPHPDQIIEILIEIIRSGRLNFPSQMLVRYHPNRSVTELLKCLESKYAGASDIFFSNPSASYAALGDLSWNAQEQDEYDLANALVASDVVISMGSTIALDAAALERPLINIAFDGYKDEPYFKSIRRIYDYTHYKKIVQTKAFTIARDPRELEEQINRYLENPSLEANERANLVALECFRLDGQSGRRAAQYVLDFLRAQSKLTPLSR